MGQDTLNAQWVGGVRDADWVAARTAELGGTVVRGPWMCRIRALFRSLTHRELL